MAIKVLIGDENFSKMLYIEYKVNFLALEND